MKVRVFKLFQSILLVICLYSILVYPADPAHFDREPGYTYPIDSLPYKPKPHKPRQYVIYRTIDSITVDGALNETSWKNAEWTNKFDNILSTRGYTRPLFATRAKMLWDDDRIYFAAEMEEPNLVGHVVINDTVVCHDNDFEIFIDVDDDAQNYIELQFNVLGTIEDIFFPKEYQRGGIVMGWPQHLYGRPYSPDWDLDGLLIAARADGSINYPLDTDEGWTLEVSIPWKSLQETTRKPEKIDQNGYYFRVGFSRVEYGWPRDIWPITDWNNRGGKSWDWTWTPNLAYDMHVPECWGRVILSGRTVLDYKDIELENYFPFVEPPFSSTKPEIGSMIKIKGGTYTVGPDRTDPEDSPEGTVTVDDFYIDRYEVTTAEFARFLNAGDHDTYYMEDMADPDFCGIIKQENGKYTVVPGKEYYPVVYMRPESAEAYAAWAGKRLPTEYEWEIATRGTESRLFPWGNQAPTPERANFNHHVGHTMPVGSYEKGKTPEGIYDMAGNVWELLSGNWTEYPWGRKIAGMPEGRQLMRGGSWVSPAVNIESTYRSAMKYSGWAAMIGFRCAKDAQ